MSASFTRSNIFSLSRFIGQIREHFGDRLALIPRPALIATGALAAVGYFSARATQLQLPPFPDTSLFLVSLAMLDGYCRIATPSTLTRTAPKISYAVFFLAITCAIGIYASYSTQRLGMPLRDDLFVAMDRALGVDLPTFLQWIDQRLLLAEVFRHAYATMALQMVAPILILGFAEHEQELRSYLVALPLALILTIAVAAFAPSTGSVWLTEHLNLNVLHFTGQTPVDQLRRLREAGPLVIGNEGLGGLLAFPSFHVASTMVVTLSLRAIRPAFFGLLSINALLIIGTITEGGHYAVDSIGGIATAFAAYSLAEKILRFRRSAESLERHA